MGKFINTTYYDTVDTLVKMNEDLIQNPFYLYNNQGKGTKVTYYNINKEKSTLDPGSKLAYADLGSNSPIRFNVVYDFYLYNFIKAELNLENGEFGLEANPLEGESYVLPNTIVPTEGDYFEVDHINDSTWLFKVNNVERDTLDNGNNVYKIGWVLDRTTHIDIVDNVVEEYKYVDTVEGTNLKSVVLLEKYDIAKDLDNLSMSLAEYFKDLFYKPNVQTFIYKWYNEYNMYDPYAIEFIIRNKLLSATEEYTYVQHQCPIPATFSLDYNRTIYRAFELRDVNRLEHSAFRSQADYIDSKVGMFHTRYEPYWSLNYKVLREENGPYNPRIVIPIVDEEFIEQIILEDLDNPDIPCYKKLIIKFFNGKDIYKDDLIDIDAIDMEGNRETFYLLLMLIFVIDFYTKKLLS